MSDAVPVAHTEEELEGDIEVRQIFELEDFVQGPAIERFRLLETIDKIALDVERACPDLTSIAAPNGTATILFTYIEGSTRLNELLGDDRWMSLLREHNEIRADTIGAALRVRGEVAG